MRTMKRGWRTGSVIAAALLVLGMSGCDIVEPTEVNPNTIPDANIDQLFTGIQVNTWFIAEGQLSRISSIFTQQMTGTDRQFAGFQEYTIDETSADTEFNALYTGGGLVDLRNAIGQAEEAGRRVYAGILKIHEAYLFGMAASVWGDLPYSEAANPEVQQPALEEQADVYAQVQSLLDEAIADLESGEGEGPGATDMVFGGDPDAWLSVAHTLKARYHLHWVEAEGDTRYEAALAAAEDGVMTVDHNWLAPHSTSATESNFWSQFQTERSGYISAGVTLLPDMRERDDPRLGLYFSGPPFWAPGEEDQPDDEATSIISPTGFGAADWDFPIVTCAENNFILAEAAFHTEDDATAQEHAVAALECQEDFYDVDLSDEIDAINAASDEALLDAIMTQKWTAQFLNIDAWNDYKRTCLPAEIEPTVEGAEIPGRLFYSGAERQSNENIPPVGEQPVRNDNDPDGCA